MGIIEKDERLCLNYDKPITVDGPISSYHSYPKNNICFIEKNDKVSSWFLFTKSK